MRECEWLEKCWGHFEAEVKEVRETLVDTRDKTLWTNIADEEDVEDGMEEIMKNIKRKGFLLEKKTKLMNNWGFHENLLLTFIQLHFYPLVLNKILNIYK